MKFLLIFLAVFVSVAKGMQEIECGVTTGAVDTEEGIFFSPGYKEGKEIPKDHLCYIQLRPNDGANKRYRVKIHDLDLTYYMQCANAFLAVQSSNIGQTHVFCGQSPVDDWMSEYDELAIIFKSDSVSSGRGFNISYHRTADFNLCPSGQLACRNRKCVPSSNKCNGEDECGDGTDEENCPHTVPPTPPPCGIPVISGGLEKIVGGGQAALGNWPWQVDFQVSMFDGNGHYCGGVVLDHLWVLTAAHCLLPAESMRVHIGNHNVYVPEEQEQVRYPAKVFAHPKYHGPPTPQYPDSMFYDIALVKMNAPIEFGSYVVPACLPKKGQDRNFGKNCYVTGWGSTFGTGSHGLLKQSQHYQLNSIWCSNTQMGWSEEYNICTGKDNERVTPCSGDSGGPFQCFDNSTSSWVVQGVASYVTGGSPGSQNVYCGATDGQQTAYCRVEAHLDWIHETWEKN